MELSDLGSRKGRGAYSAIEPMLETVHEGASVTEADGIRPMDMPWRSRPVSTASTRDDYLYDSSVYQAGPHSPNSTTQNLLRLSQASFQVDNDPLATHMSVQSLKQQLWVPWALTIISIVVPIALCWIMFALTIVFNWVVIPDDGFFATEIGQRILFTYVPPIIFTLIHAHWNSVEYWTKRQTPWKELSTGSSPAARSVLLDYVNPWNWFSSVYKSIKFRHWAVLFASLDSFILKLLIIFWSGPLLFHLASPTRSSTVVMVITLKALPVYVTLVLVPVFTACAVGLIKTRPIKVTPRDLSTVGGLATVMAQSGGFVATMQGRTGLIQEKLSQYVAQARYGTVVAQGEDGKSSFKLQTRFENDEMEKNSLPAAASIPTRWWNPLTGVVRIGALAFTILCLILVEVSNQFSTRKHGLTDVTGDVAQASWAFWPAVILFLLYGVYNAIDFFTRLMTPFAQLHKHQSNNSDSIMLSYLGNVAPMAFFRAAKRKHHPVVASSFSMILAPIVIIVASGLFVSRIETVTRVVNAKMTNDFDIYMAPNSTNIKPLGDAVKSLVQGNDSWPKWTSNSLVFPKLDIGAKAMPEQSAGPQASLNMDVPALFVSLQCSRVPSNTVKFWVDGANSSLVRHFAIPVPLGCGAPCTNNTAVDTCMEEKAYIYLGNSTFKSDATWFGRVFLSKPSPQPYGWTNQCPHVSVVYGANTADTKAYDKTIVLNCNPAVFFTEATTNFSLPDWKIQSTKKIDSMAKVIADGDTATLDLNSILPDNSVDKADFDNAFATIMNPREGPISLSSLDSSDSSISAINASLESTYARIMAQHLHLNTRVTPSDPLPSLNGTLFYPSRLRIVQQAIPSRIIEVLLGLMFLALLASMFTLDTRRLLPHSPTTIAAQAALIADSEIVKREIVPPGAEWLDDGSLARQMVFSGLFFSLGVWEKKGGGRRVFGIDIGRAQGA